MIFEHVVQAAREPEWEEFHKQLKHVHDWRTYIPEGFEKNWENIPIECRMYMVGVADNAASMESWD